MAKFNKEVLSSIDASVLCWLATASADNVPNVSPKEIFVAKGVDTLLIANIASPKSAANVRANPNVCVSFIDILVQKGFQITGSATLVESSTPDFESLAEPLLKIAGPRFPFSSLFKVTATRIKPILAPSYTLYPETTEQQQIESAKRRYGLDAD